MTKDSGGKERKTYTTDQELAGLKARGKAYTVADGDCKGLLVRVGINGGRTFAMAYHSPLLGKTRWLNLGRYPELRLKAARLLVGEARSQIAKGIDPGLEQAAVKAEQVGEAETSEKKRTTYSELIALFDAQVLSKQRDQRDRSRMLVRIGERFGWSNKPASELTPVRAWEALTALANKTTDGYGGPVAARHNKSMLNSLYKWACQPHRGYVDHNPFRDLEAPAPKPEPRERILHRKDELPRVMRALDREQCGVPAHHAIALKLMLATAARPGMVAAMERAELLNLDQPQPAVRHGQSGVGIAPVDSGPIWSLPREKMKKNRPFMLPLSSLAVELIAASQSRTGFVVAGPRGKKALTVNELGRSCEKVWRALGIPRFTPHDLRRTAATLLGEQGWNDFYIGKMLGHDSDNVTGRVYNRSGYMIEKRAMVTLLERLIREAGGVAAREQEAA